MQGHATPKVHYDLKKKKIIGFSRFSILYDFRFVFTRRHYFWSHCLFCHEVKIFYELEGGGGSNKSNK